MDSLLGGRSLLQGLTPLLQPSTQDQGLLAAAGEEEGCCCPGKPSPPAPAAACCSPPGLLSSQSILPPPSPAALTPAALPPSPFDSPRKLARSPSKPPTPQRLALRSPFAGGSCGLEVGLPPPVGAASPAPARAALVQRLPCGGSPLQQGVARELLLRLRQQQQRGRLGAGQEGEGLHEEEEVSEAEAAQIAAMVLLHCQASGAPRLGCGGAGSV